MQDDLSVQINQWYIEFFNHAVHFDKIVDSNLFAKGERNDVRLFRFLVGLEDR